MLNAQSIQTGKLTGTVTDDGGEPLPGVQVEISSEALISGQKLTTTSESGSYVFLNLPIGTYRVTASAPSFSKMVRDNVDLSADTVVTIDFTMQMGQIEESVTVSAEGEIVDTKNSVVNTSFNEEMIDRLPTARDAFYDLTLTAPGMFDTGRDSSWLPSPTAYGSGTNENAFLVNGVNATSPRGGGFGSLVNVNYDTVEEVRIVALGAKAEYGSATGVAVDVLTKSGSNKYHGEATVYSQLGKPSDNSPDAGDDLGEDWLALDPTTSLLGRTERDREFSFVVGGPIVKDRVWFFGGVNFLGEETKEPLWPVLLQNNEKYYDLKFQRHQTIIMKHGSRITWNATTMKAQAGETLFPGILHFNMVPIQRTTPFPRSGSGFLAPKA
jgi:hypothetical protein